jgi:iron complex outermembrane receptor protein
MTVKPFSPRPLLLATLVAAAWPALSQTSAEAQRVEVTGSHIKRTDSEGPSPLQVITREQIEHSGARTAAELLDTLTANNNAGGQYRSNNTNNTVVGASGVSLRGLGPNSTLVLLNGRRVAFYGFSDQSVFVDLNTIALSAIERVEVVKDGASAIYGSDALAGVVNFILRERYQGVDLRLSSGRSLSYSDHDQTTATLTAGTTLGRLSLLGIAELHHQGAVAVSARDGGTQAARTAGAIAAGYTSPLLFEGAGIGGNFPATSSSAGNWYSGNPAHGGRVEYYAAGRCEAPNQLYSGTYNGYGASGMCLDTRTDRFNTLWPEARKASLFGRASYEFSPTMSAFGELSLSRIEQAYEYWPVFKNDYYDVGTTPHFPLAQAPAGWGYYARLYDELGAKVRDVRSASTRLVSGLRGVAAGWDWELALTQSRNRTDFAGRNYISNAVWYDGVADGSINPFQRLTDANIEALRTTHTRVGESRFTLLDASLVGSVGRLPAGPVQLALGLNLRRERMADGIDDASNAGRVENVAVRLPIEARRSADAVYAELSLPLARTLEAQLALRRDHFADAGSSINPKLAMKWTPSAQLALRGSYSTGFRAPSLAEMHGGTRMYVNCPATVPVCPAFNQVWGNQVTVSFLDSPDLEPEKSRSGNIGMVWEPVRNHSLALDAWSVRRRHQVYAPSLTNPADSAYFTFLSPASNAAAAAFQATYVNLGSTTVQGADLGWHSRWSIADRGQLRASLSSTYMARFDSEFRGTTTSGVGRYGTPRWRHRAEAGWSHPAWTAVLSASHRGAFDQAVAAADGSAVPLKSFTSVDLYLAWHGAGRGLTLSGFVGNLLGSAPPFDRLGRVGTLYEDNSDRRTLWLTLQWQVR